MCVCVRARSRASACARVNVLCMEVTPWRPDQDMGSIRVGVTYSFEPPYVGNKWSQEDREFKASLGFRAFSRPDRERETFKKFPFPIL